MKVMSSETKWSDGKNITESCAAPRDARMNSAYRMAGAVPRFSGWAATAWTRRSARSGV
jgi:hypothetical protein